MRKREKLRRKRRVKRDNRFEYFFFKGKLNFIRKKKRNNKQIKKKGFKKTLHIHLVFESNSEIHYLINTF